MSKVDDDHHAHKTVYQSAGAEVLTQIFSIRYTRELEELKSSVARALVGCPKPVGELLFQYVHSNILIAIQSASFKWKLNAPSYSPCGFASWIVSGFPKARLLEEAPCCGGLSN
jgi:hypothetical protein